MEPAFAHLKQTTKCPFAKGSRVHSAPDWDFNLPFDANAERHGEALRDFVVQVEPERLHGFVSKVGCNQPSPSFAMVAEQFCRYLRALAKTDESCAACMSQDVLSRDWQFTYAGTRCFINVFASCYADVHSKRCDVTDGFYVFFQPERSFDFCGRSLLDTFKHEIRRRFADAGMPYDGALIDDGYEALIYMFPEEPFGAPVEWWRQG
jgi:hypothetical protein